MPVELQLAYHAGCDQCERVKNMHQLVQSPNTQFDLHKLRTGLEELSSIPRLPFLGIITSCRHHSLHKGSNAEIIVILTVWKLKEPTPRHNWGRSSILPLRSRPNNRWHLPEQQVLYPEQQMETPTRQALESQATFLVPRRQHKKMANMQHSVRLPPFPTPLTPL